MNIIGDHVIMLEFYCDGVYPMILFQDIRKKKRKEKKGSLIGISHVVNFYLTRVCGCLCKGV